MLRLLHTLTCRSLAWDDPVNYEFRWRNQSSVGFSELLLVSNSKGQRQPWTSEMEPLWPSFSHIPIFHLLVGNHSAVLTHPSHPCLCCGFQTGYTWKSPEKLVRQRILSLTSEVLIAWVQCGPQGSGFLHPPQASPQQQRAVGIPYAWLCTKHHEVMGMKSYLCVIPQSSAKGYCAVVYTLLLKVSHKCSSLWKQDLNLHRWLSGMGMGHFGMAARIFLHPKHVMGRKELLSLTVMVSGQQQKNQSLERGPSRIEPVVD